MRYPLEGACIYYTATWSLSAEDEARASWVREASIRSGSHTRTGYQALIKEHFTCREWGPDME